MSVQGNIRKIREAKGVTQTAVAKYLGVSKMRYNRFELTNKNINSNWLPVIASYLGVEVNIFFKEKLTESVIKSLKTNAII